MRFYFSKCYKDGYIYNKKIIFFKCFELSVLTYVSKNKINKFYFKSI